MSSILDWITVNPWAIALAAVAFACVGYALTRPAALRGSSSSDDSSAWVAFCIGLYPDTRKMDGDEDESASVDDSAPGSDASGDSGD